MLVRSIYDCMLFNGENTTTMGNATIQDIYDVTRLENAFSNQDGLNPLMHMQNLA